MAVTDTVIHRRVPYAGALEFSGIGQYEWITGEALVELDVDHAANAAITDIAFAQCNSRGKVELATDFVELRPALPSRRNGRLLHCVPNRGTPWLPFTRGDTSIIADVAVPRSDGHVTPSGDPILLREGWTLAWSGWQFDLAANPMSLSCRVPEAMQNGIPIRGQVSVHLRPSSRCASQALCDWTMTQRGPRAADGVYPVAQPLEQPTAALLVRNTPQAQPAVIPKSEWRFARENSKGEIEASAHHVWLKGGFEAGRLYEVVYTTDTCPVVGCGMAAVRDVVSYLRKTEAVSHVVAYGLSQAARLLRQFIFDGMNVDESGQIVFDGIFCQYPGAKRGDFNHRYALPSEGFAPGFATLPPYALDSPSGGLLDRQRRVGGVPKIVTVSSGWEYWRGDAALAHVDPWEEVDLEEAAESRTYLITGSDHMGHVAHVGAQQPLLNERNTLDPTPVLRALFVALVSWVCDGVEPPSSMVPRIADGTAVRRDDALRALANVSGLRLPDQSLLPTLTELDLGERAPDKVGAYPARTGRVLPCFVPDVDAAGNERAGIRLPCVAAALGTFTGWNVTAGPLGALAAFRGSYARTQEASGDGSASAASRWRRDRDQYVATVAATVEALIHTRLLLSEDAEYVTGQALEAYDATTKTLNDFRAEAVPS